MVYNLDDMGLDELSRRALSAYFETGGDVMPSAPVVKRIRGKRYVLLSKGAKLLACYRVRNDGKLKRLVRLPNGLSNG